MEKPEAYPLEPEKQKSLWRYHNKLVQNPGRALKKHQRIATFMDAVEAEYQAESSILAKPLLSEKETKSALSKIIFKKREQKRDKHGPLYKLFVGKPLASYPYSTERENIDKVLEKLDHYAEFTAAYNHEDKQLLLERMTALRDKLLNISAVIGSCKEYYMEQSIQAPAQKFNFRGLVLTKWW
jgi:hypothetical protein